MVTVLFMGTTAICAIGWLVNLVAARSILYYMAQKGYKPPTEVETKACTLAVVKKMFKISR